MKRFLLSCILLSAAFSLKAQDSHKNDIVNTLKERISIGGYAQVGYTYDDASEGSNNEFDIKRVILLTEGKITDRWSVVFQYSFANTAKVLEAYSEYRFLPQLKVRVGQFKTQYTIENPMSPCDQELINCNAQVVAYLAGINGSDPLYGASTGRDLGLMVHGDLFGKLMSYNIAVMNGQGMNMKDRNNRKDIVGGLTVNPLEWLSVAGSFINGKGCAIATSDYNPDIAVGDSYTRNRWAIGATVETRPVSLRTEYLAGKDGHVKSDGYYAVASFHVLPKFDIIASYDYFNRNKAIGDKQSNYVAGVQWWFYPRCRVQAQYTYRDPRQGEGSNLLQAQIQVRF